jgi:hypothetical protein
MKNHSCDKLIISFNIIHDLLARFFLGGGDGQGKMLKKLVGIFHSVGTESDPQLPTAN